MDQTQTKRVELFKKLQKSRESALIAIVTSDRPGLSAQMKPDLVRIAFDMAKEAIGICAKRPKTLDIFLYSRGGDSDVPWALMSSLRELTPKMKICVLIPYRAHSAATIAALGADSIVMGPKAELGPIDTTMLSPYNPTRVGTSEPLPVSVEDIMGYFSLLEKIGCTGPDAKIEGLKELARQIHPYALGMVQRLEDQTKLVAGQLLASRREPFPEAENYAIVGAVAKRINSHNHAISRTEAREHVGLRSVVDAEQEGIADELWDMFLLYEEKFEMNRHFLPEEEFFADESLEVKSYADMPIVCVENEKRCKTLLSTVTMKRVRQQLQSLSVAPQIHFPPIAVPPGLDQAQVEALVQQWMNIVLPAVVQQAVDDAVQKVIKKSPTIGFEKRENSTKWADVPA